MIAANMNMRRAINVVDDDTNDDLHCVVVIPTVNICIILHDMTYVLSCLAVLSITLF